MEAILRHLCQIHDLRALSVGHNAKNETPYNVSVFVHFNDDDCESGQGGTFDEAFAIAMKKVRDARDNAAEAAWQSHQEALMESGGSDNGAYYRDMKAAGRSHLLTEA